MAHDVRRARSQAAATPSTDPRARPPLEPALDALDPPSARRERDRLVDEIVARGEIQDARVIAALRRVPRHLFVPAAYQDAAYADHPLSIGEGQTISQPSIVALMTQALALEGSERVLEIGTGSGYQAAILSHLASEVFSIERISDLSEGAGAELARLGCKNVRLRVGDGYEGWAEHAPYDRIIVTAAPPGIPRTLVNQLADGGRMVIPTGEQLKVQKLLVCVKDGGRIACADAGPVRFVPMIAGLSH